MLVSLLYSKEKGVFKPFDLADLDAQLKNRRSLIWLDMTDPSEDDIGLMVDTFQFHPLAIEDAIFPQNHPKLDDYGDHLFIVVHEMVFDPEQERFLDTRELNIFVGENFVITVHAGPVAAVTKILQACQHKPVLLSAGAGFLVHCLIDHIVDGYFPVVEKLEGRIEQVEDQVLAGADKNVLAGIMGLKKGIITLRNFLAPQRKLVAVLARSHQAFLRRVSQYFRDVSDHVERVSNMIDTYRDILNSAMEAYLSVVSHRLNEIMKTLTIIATFMMPLTVITSFYGMNVKAPEFEWGIKGYYYVIALLAAAVVVMILFLKRRKWI